MPTLNVFKVFPVAPCETIDRQQQKHATSPFRRKKSQPMKNTYTYMLMLRTKNTIPIGIIV